MSARSNPHEDAVRAVVDTAHEVRVELYDSRVIFGSVIATSEANPHVFVIRPWGRKLPMTIPLVDVLRAIPVTGMIWERQRSISMAQMAGTFKGNRPAS
jgi:hypothetical protein